MAEPPVSPAITITYATHASPQSASVLSHVTKLLAAQFPLRNVHWRPGPETRALRPRAQRDAETRVHAIRTLQLLPVDLVPLSAHTPGDTRLSLLQRAPCAHLFFVACDDSDLYRAQIRNEVRNWIAALPAHMPADVPGMDAPATEPEYLIVLIPPVVAGAAAATGGGAGGKGAIGRFYTMNKGSVLEKLRADFNSSTHDHVVALPRLPASATPAPADAAVWIELLARLKESTAATIGSRIERLDAGVTECELRAADDDWSFCALCNRAERLIRLLGDVDLLDDCLALYDELDERLSAGLASGHVTFPRVGATDAGDDSLLLLGPLRKPYEDLVAREAISLFDMRCYLFARRAMLLGAIGRVVAVMQATPAFVASTAHLLRARRPRQLPPLFIESWSFSVALDAVEQCQAWLVEQDSDADDAARTRASSSHAFHVSKAELLDLAIQQLVRIGVRVGHLPVAAPFTYVFSARPAPASRDAPGITRKELCEAIVDVDVFDSQLRTLLQRAVLACTLCGHVYRQRQLQYLHVCLEMERGAYAAAARLLGDLITPGAERSWGSIAVELHAMRLACMEACGEAVGRPWVAALVDAVHAACAARPLRTPDGTETALIAQLRTAAGDADVTLSGYNGYSVRLAQHRAERRADDDGAFLRVSVVSHLSAALAVDAVSVCVADYRQAQLWFTSAPLTLLPGANTAIVFCATPAAGFFHVQATQIRAGHVLLENIVQDRAALSTLADAQQLEYQRARIFVPADGDALRVRCVRPTDMRTDVRRAFELELWSGRNHVVSVNLSVDVGGGALAAREATYKCTVHAADRSVDATEAAAGAAPPASTGAPSPPSSPPAAPLQLTLHAVPPHSTARIVVPLALVPRSARFTVALTARYRTQQSHPDAMRVRTTVCPVDVSLPIGIHVQDHFRLDRLISRLTLESGAVPVRVQAPDVQAPASGSPIAACAQRAGPPTVIAPRQPRTHVISFSPPHARRTEHTTFRLHVAFRTLRDECGGRLLERVARILARAGSWERSQWTPADFSLFLTELEGWVPSAVDIGQYASTGRLVLKPNAMDYWERCMQRWGWPAGGAQWDNKSEDLEAHGDDRVKDKREREDDQVTGRKVNTGLAWDGDSSRSRDGADDDRKDDVVQDGSNPASTLPTPADLAENAASRLMAWSTLSLPLDLPAAGAVNAVSMRVPTPLVLGQSVEATVEVASSFAWHEKGSDSGSDGDDHDSDASHPSVAFQYDIIADYDHWLVWGQKKGLLHVDASSAIARHTLSATLIPVRAGSLLLPRVRLTPIGMPESYRSETYMTTAAAPVAVMDQKGHDTFWVDLRNHADSRA
ncbi:hypothetical protein MSPP1_000709 [Malassezia sp. CBS 17886]|nr:hypothetical protein MSPP1_000709 [Malassezia sp. CBS 17886]